MNGVAYRARMATDREQDHSPLPWRVSDGHGLCVVDRDGRIVCDLTPQADWADPPPRERLRANAERIVAAANSDA